MLGFKQFTMLSEMILRYGKGAKEHDRNIIVAYKESLWIVPSEISYKDYDTFNRFGMMQIGNQPLDAKVMKEISAKVGKEVSTSKDLILLKRERPDVLVLFADENHIQYDRVDVFSQNVNSPLFRKTIDLLQKSGFPYKTYDQTHGYDKDMEKGTSSTDIKFGYHGTSLKQIESILKTGIRSQDTKNFANIEYKNVIFFDVIGDYAWSHAELKAKKDGSIPVVIKFKIPDQSKIIPDLDVAGFTMKKIPAAYAGTAIPDGMLKDMGDIKRPENFAKHFIAYGYQGRIPASQFIEFYSARNLGSSNNTKTTAAEIKKVLAFFKEMSQYKSFKPSVNGMEFNEGLGKKSVSEQIDDIEGFISRYRMHNRSFDEEIAKKRNEKTALQIKAEKQFGPDWYETYGRKMGLWSPDM